MPHTASAPSFFLPGGFDGSLGRDLRGASHGGIWKRARTAMPVFRVIFSGAGRNTHSVRDAGSYRERCLHPRGIFPRSVRGCSPAEPVRSGGPDPQYAQERPYPYLPVTVRILFCSAFVPLYKVMYLFKEVNHDKYEGGLAGTGPLWSPFVNLLTQKRHLHTLSTGPQMPRRIGRGGGTRRNRTSDTRIFSPLLYQLS